MPRKINTPEQINNTLREVEVLINQGTTTMEASRKTEKPVQSIHKYPMITDFLKVAGKHITS